VANFSHKGLIYINMICAMRISIFSYKILFICRISNKTPSESGLPVANLDLERFGLYMDDSPTCFVSDLVFQEFHFKQGHYLHPFVYKIVPQDHYHMIRLPLRNGLDRI
jgi:hypothetical protein